MAVDTLTSTPSPSNINVVPSKPTPGIKMGGEIHLTPPSTPALPETSKPGTAREGLSQRLQKAGAQPPVTPPVTLPPKTNEPATPTPAEPAVPPETPETPAATATPEEKKRVSPWKLVDEYKGKAAQAEMRALEIEKELDAIRKGSYPKEVQEKLSKAESRAKELEDEIRFVSYEKSAEFKDKFDAPYVNAWNDALSELGELTVTGPDQQPRAFGAQDIMDLVNLPLQKARELADSLYGHFANDVMAHRTKIKDLFKKRGLALDEAKKSGAAREQQQREQHQKTYTEISEQVKTHWERSNADALADPANGQFFKPVEGDEHWNQRLAKGFELVDRAFAESPLDPKLNAEQRAAVVKRHAAVRNRAAAFGPLKYKLSKVEAENAALKKELEQFRGSEPDLGGQRQAQVNGGGPANARDSVMNNLRKLAAR